MTNTNLTERLGYYGLEAHDPIYSSVSASIAKVMEGTLEGFYREVQSRDELAGKFLSPASMAKARAALRHPSIRRSRLSSSHSETCNSSAKRRGRVPLRRLSTFPAPSAVKRQAQAWVSGSGSPRREFMHVEDMADACVFLMEAGVNDGLFNVGLGDDVTIRELAGVIMEVVGFEGRIVFDSTKPDGTPRKLLAVERSMPYSLAEPI